MWGGHSVAEFKDSVFEHNQAVTLHPVSLSCVNLGEQLTSGSIDDQLGLCRSFRLLPLPSEPRTGF